MELLAKQYCWAILNFVSWFCRGWPLWIQMGHVGGRRAFAKSSAAHQPPWAPWAALALSSPEHSAVSSEQRRTPEQRKTESVEQRAPMGKLLRLLWFHLVSVIFLQRVLQNKGDKSICPVLSTRICQKSYFETTTLHNVYILEYLFIRTEQAGTYLKICHLLYQSTYIFVRFCSVRLNVGKF